MTEDIGGFLLEINHFIAELREVNAILQSYDVASAAKLKEKIERRTIPEHPTYEDYLEVLQLGTSLKKRKLRILDYMNRMMPE